MANKMLLVLTYLLLFQASICTKHQRKVLLNDGNKMPPIAFGTFSRGDKIYKTSQAVTWAIEAGYRHIDTAAFYQNEEYVGRGIQNVISRGIVKRRDLFITTKLNFGYNSSMVPVALRASLDKLQLDYVDLYLIHTPNNWLTGKDYDIVDTWKGMEQVKSMGLARSIGVSNFNTSHINKILTNGHIRPAVNQLELNPTYANLALTAYCQTENIVVESYAPNGYLVPRPFHDYIPPPSVNDPTLRKLAKKYGKSVHQLFIRYLIDRGTVPIPKSFTKRRLEENLDVFDFSFSKDDVYLMNEFNKNIKVYGYTRDEADALFRYYFGEGLEAFFDS